MGMTTNAYRDFFQSKAIFLIDTGVGTQHCGCANALEMELDTSQINVVVGRLNLNKAFTF